MSLPYDYCRCIGRRDNPFEDTRCPVRETCQRYLSRNDVGPRTPFTMWLCSDTDYKERIPHEPTR